MPIIKRVVIEGFRVYRNRLEPAPFSPRHNVVVGANGSGKSNFFAAIQFVLGDLGSSTTLRAEERRLLLHEGVGHAATTAFVEVHFDNSDGHLPIERDAVIVKRAVELRKDEYYLDGKHATKTEIASLLESAGLSRSNPTHIVPQGRVIALTTMKDEARLKLLREVSGTSTYACLASPLHFCPSLSDAAPSALPLSLAAAAHSHPIPVLSSLTPLILPHHPAPPPLVCLLATCAVCVLKQLRRTARGEHGDHGRVPAAEAAHHRQSRDD